MANTDTTHLPGDVFSTPAFILEVDQTRQFNERALGAGSWTDDPEHPDDESGASTASTQRRSGRRQPTLNPLVDPRQPRYRRVPTPTTSNTPATTTSCWAAPTGDDILIASIGDDTLWGDGGNDRLEGGDGNDMIIGGAGDDIITDHGGDDNLQGEDGNDVIQGGNGFNLIIGGAATTSSSPAKTSARPSAARATTSSSAPR